MCDIDRSTMIVPVKVTSPEYQTILQSYMCNKTIWLPEVQTKKFVIRKYDIEKEIDELETKLESKIEIAKDHLNKKHLKETCSGCESWLKCWHKAWGAGESEMIKDNSTEWQI